MLHIYIGYDPRQPISFTVLAQSIAIRSSQPVSITPLILEQLPIERAGLTPFTFTRFLVPWLSNYKGWSLFLDADILLADDISQLFDFAEDKYSVMVSKNEKRFEWASVMLFNNAKCQMLTPEYVESAKDLHRIGFVDESEIGDLPRVWNHLVGYDEPRNNPSLIHYTQGVPVWDITSDCEHAEAYKEIAQFSVSAKSWEELMGQSVHAGVDSEGNKVPLYKLKEAENNAQTANTG